MKTKKYRIVLIDLDGTLWDFRRNSAESLKQIFDEYLAGKTQSTFSRFTRIYHKNNDDLWKAYREGKIEKDVLRWKRFDLTLKQMGIDSFEMAKILDRQYLERSKMKTTLVEGALEILDYLFPKYRLCLVTNGFNEVQFTKIKNSGLEKYFSEIITSEMAGQLKPATAFFEFVLNICNTETKDCILIGDDPVADIKGARESGIDQIFFCPDGDQPQIAATHTINELGEIRNIL